MYVEDEIIDDINLPESVVGYIEEVLDANFEDIQFVFIGYDMREGEEYAIISAETEEEFMLINCPSSYLLNYSKQYKEETEYLLEYVLVEWALEKLHKAQTEEEKTYWLEQLHAMTD